VSKVLNIMKQIVRKKQIAKNKEVFLVRDAREKEFFIVDDAYMNGFAKICGVYATAVYFALCRHSGKDQMCYPSIDLIMDKLNMSRGSVVKALKILEWHKIILIDKIKGQPNVYTLTNKRHWIKLKHMGYGYICKGEAKNVK